MKEFSLFLESGPKKRKTMVHVLDLLGCVVRGSTTEEALSAVPTVIENYLLFLKSSGEKFDPLEPFSTHVAAHVMEGGWVGEGDPTPGFVPDFLSVNRSDFLCYVFRLNAIHNSILALLKDISINQLTQEPPDGHRSLYRILEHAAESEYTYLRMQMGPDKEIAAACKALSPNDPGLFIALKQIWHLINTRLLAFSDDALAQLVPHGQITWSAYRMMRRMLEHSWEHREEIRERTSLI
jgi:predicted RNase H-like HicB family nuclease